MLIVVVVVVVFLTTFYRWYISLAEPDPLSIRFARKRVWEHTTILLVLLEFNLNNFFCACYDIK